MTTAKVWRLYVFPVGMFTAGRVHDSAQQDRALHHAHARQALHAAYQALRPGTPVRLAKPASNLFRFRPPHAAPGLDVSAFDQVIEVDVAERSADVQGMVTYERLVDATLAHGLMPLVVPQLKTITLGGAIAGLGIESSSFRSGLPHESVLEMEILTGDGRIVLARPDNEHADLFRGFPNSYGTLGYALRLKIELEPVKPFVRLRHLRFDNAEACFAAIAAICAQGSHDGEPVDFLDGTVFGREEMYLTLATFVYDLAASTGGTFAANPSQLSDYTGMAVYYQSIRERTVDHLSVRDYLWRWDTDWFWCSRAFGVQTPLVRRLWPRRYRRSDVYRRLVALDHRHRISAQLDRLRGRPPQEAVVQDVEVPVTQGPAFLEFFHRDLGITPIWLCPLRLRDSRTWPLYPLAPEELYVNLGFWSSVPLRDGQPDGFHNRLVEQAVTALGGHKSLYSTAYYGQDEFWRLYNGPSYTALKAVYDPDGRLPDLYDKCVRMR
jgi:FAD/FMN-containing dehydrogenase